ncbi:MAG: tetratricopeptide repeat protein [Gemmatimonadetes bacterium]|uniref:Tetratricopeptide repeat protein n=1 Tax=Candidatus Kutchimonas denitrificans TaxID=3056748 RepID=A0AAE5CCU4_9BACT|nr:tetratricopeptide repeat protein [Gemmatimonadota bacterium]NIR74669.1 tetratricopeptide repeat protein [Candidatus Kutchimonas denitrificans]NIS01419.1 tetratricopeptide repeat protein [Gemmatimonadota bacterium]NIT67160.1 tetratricopeptide repeat protein [Gemmatimonadota bacterium]NIU52334.1 tetratricopeptide repeat protein [Gemmatimonadota bacterium]
MRLERRTFDVFPGRASSRARLLATCLCLSSPLAASPLPAQTPNPGSRVITLTDTLAAAVGGVAVDEMGAIYVADFRETVWKVNPDGQAAPFATGLYGASGNAIDSKGNLLQANFYGDYVSRIDRTGAHEIVADGLNGPVGIAVDEEDNFYVCNCRANSVSFVTADGDVSTFVESDLFVCPNGITRDPDGNLYVVNFRGGRMLKVTPEAEVSELALLPGGGNGHVTMARGSLYATSFQGHRIYRVSLEGEVTLIAGTGARGEKDGPALEATFTFPNGIAAGPRGDRLYVNDFINRFPPGVEVPPQPLSVVRQIKLASISDLLVSALRSGGPEAMVEAYQEWKNDPATAGVYTEIEVNRLGYSLMGSGQLEAAIEVFKLNVESYPNSFNVYDSLAEAYMNAGEDELAVEYYEKSLEINPGNTNAVEMLEKLRGP